MSYNVTFMMCDGKLRISSHPLSSTTLSQYLEENGWEMSYDDGSHKLLIKRDGLHIVIQAWYFSGIDIEISKIRCKTLGSSSLKSVQIEFDNDCLTIRGDSGKSTYSCVVSVNG